jgi:hypothetical protein
MGAYVAFSLASLGSVALAFADGCSSSDAAVAPGTGAERQACYANGTCNAGLTCASDICVALADGAVAADSGSDAVGPIPDGAPGTDAADGAVPCGAACNPVAATINDIDTATVAVGSGVDVSGVFVTAVDSASGTFWIADALTAQANHGLMVIAATPLPAGVLIGATVDVTAALVTAPKGLLQLGAIPTMMPSPKVTVVAAPTAPPTAAAGASVVSTAAEAPFVGSLVTISNFKVASVTGSGASKRYTLTGAAGSVLMGTQLYDVNATVGICFATVTAIATLDVVPATPAPMLLPRGPQTTGGACP